MQTMSYRPLGRSGLKVSTLSLGGWTTYGGSVNDQNLIGSIIRKAYEAGINFFDIADVYANGESELAMGKVLKEFPRHHLVVSSKVFFPMSENVNDRGLSRKHIMESVEMSLKRLGMDHLDLYFCHRYDDSTPLEETVRAMDDLVHQGKVLYWGTSSWSREQLSAAMSICREGRYYLPQVEQPQYSLLENKKISQEVAPFASENGMGLVTWSPLASGVLSGKYDNGIPKDSRLANMTWLKDNLYNETNLQRVRDLKKIADKLDCSRSQLAIAWVAAQHGVSSVITGATSEAQLVENLGALRVEITRDVMAEIAGIFASGVGH